MKRIPKKLTRAAKTGTSLLTAVTIVLAISGCSSHSESKVANISTDDPQKVFSVDGKISDSLKSTTFVAPTYSPAILDWDDMSFRADEISPFSLMEGSVAAPAIPQSTIEDLQDSIAYFEDGNADFGFCIVDLKSGKGIAHNIDTRIYGASSMKAHAVVFACQKQVAEGKIPFESFSGYAYSAIVDSNDEAYTNVKRITGGYTQAMYDWLDKMNLDHYLADDTDFPRYTVRDSMKLWTNAFLFLSEGSEEAQQVQTMMESTGMSFLRDGIFQDPGEGAITVLNKAGWIADPEDGCFAVVDAGIIFEDGHPYLISAMSNAFDSIQNRRQISNVCSQLWNARSCLA